MGWNVTEQSWGCRETVSWDHLESVHVQTTLLFSRIYKEILNVIDNMCSFIAVPVSNLRVAHICNVLMKLYKLNGANETSRIVNYFKAVNSVGL